MPDNRVFNSPPAAVSRRQLLQTLGVTLAVPPLVQLAGCSSSDPGNNPTGSGAAATGGTDGTGTRGSAGAGGTSGGTGGTSGSADAATMDAGGWATGGTASIRGNYPDPFAGGLGNACKLTCAAILGPCYAATIERKDISEGHDGLPVRFAFLIVDESCQPIPGAVIDIWHVSPRGVYSGNDSVAMCTLDDPEALASRWFRGTQTTDALGRADFDSCFPGWYSGRTIHIHFTIRLGATEYLTSQLYFDDAVCDDITTTQSIYNTRGVRDTTNKTDAVIAETAVRDYSFQVARMADGAMLASKAIVIRSQTSSPLCDTPGGNPGSARDGGFPPFDGPPPDGFGGFPPRDAGQGGG